MMNNSDAVSEFRIAKWLQIEAEVFYVATEVVLSGARGPQDILAAHVDWIAAGKEFREACDRFEAAKAALAVKR